MLRDEQQLARACRALLATVHLERLWTDDGPTPEASELLEADGGPLSSGERIVLLAAWTFWNGSGGRRLAEVLEQFDGDPMEALCFLVMASKCGGNRGVRTARWWAPTSPTSRCLHRQQLHSSGTDHLLRRREVLLKPAKDSVDVLIFASDIRKSLDFYQGTLGLEKTEEVQTPYGNVHRLRYGTSLVKLMDPKQVPPAGPIGLDKQLGIRCLSFVIRDLSGVCTVLKKKGVEFTVPETQVLPGLRIAMVKDPDGKIIEFVEGE